LGLKPGETPHSINIEARIARHPDSLEQAEELKVAAHSIYHYANKKDFTSEAAGRRARITKNDHYGIGTETNDALPRTFPRCPRTAKNVNYVCFRARNDLAVWLLVNFSHRSGNNENRRSITANCGRDRQLGS